MSIYRFVFLGACALLLVAAAPLMAASAQVTLAQPASLHANATVDACTNHQGPFITLNGELAFGGVNARLIFRNNQKGTHEREEDVTADIVLLPAGETIRFNKQPSRGGVGGNPWIYSEFFDGDGNSISNETLLGRCVQGLDPTNIDFTMLTAVALDVTGGGCSNSGGPNITLSGELTLGGLGATIRFTNNEKGTHEHYEETEVGIRILDAGESITFAKQPPLGGVGGNPLIYLQFVDAGGNAMSGEFFLGRCTKL